MILVKCKLYCGLCFKEMRSLAEETSTAVHSIYYLGDVMEIFAGDCGSGASKAFFIIIVRGTLIE